MTDRARTLSSIAPAVLVTLSLFVFMQHLIAKPPELDPVGVPLASVRFHAIEHQPHPEPVRSPPPKRPPPAKQPPRLTTPAAPTLAPDRSLLQFNLPRLPGPAGAGADTQRTSGTDPVDSGPVALVQIQPMYPRIAASRQIEGFVTVAFTISPTGLVVDPVILESRPPRVFDREALRAIMRWRFRPTQVNGSPVEQRAVQTLEFRLDRR